MGGGYNRLIIVLVSEHVCASVQHGSQSIWPNEKAPHTHTNTRNPPASSVSASEGACSVAWRCFTTARGLAGMLTGKYVENISPWHRDHVAFHRCV